MIFNCLPIVPAPGESGGEIERRDYRLFVLVDNQSPLSSSALAWVKVTGVEVYDARRMDNG